MSQNVLFTYRLHGAVNRLDLDGFLALVDPDVEFTPYQVALQDGDPYRGHAGVRRWWEDTFLTRPRLRAELDEVRDLGDMVLVKGRLPGGGAGAGYGGTVWAVVEWRDGHAVWWHSFPSEAQALEAVEQRNRT